MLLAFPIAALCALVYRFPIPFGAYESGVDAVPRALFATAFYGLLGGFVVLAIGGYIAGVAAVGMGHSDTKRTARLTAAMATLVALAGVMLLAVLDKLIGPW